MSEYVLAFELVYISLAYLWNFLPGPLFFPWYYSGKSILFESLAILFVSYMREHEMNPNTLFARYGTFHILLWYMDCIAMYILSNTCLIFGMISWVLIPIFKLIFLAKCIGITWGFRLDIHELLYHEFLICHYWKLSDCGMWAGSIIKCRDTLL